MSFWVAGAAIGGAVISSQGAKSAAGQQAGASQAAIDAAQKQYDQTRSDQAPYRSVGDSALNQLADLTGVKQFDSTAYLAANPDVAADPYWSQHAQDHYLEHGQSEGRQATYTQPDSTFGSYAQGPTAAQVQMDPGYQFGLDQGQQAIDRQTAASGGRVSGAALKAAAQYGTDYATTKYGDAYNRVNQARSDRLNRLAALAGIGQTSTQQTGAAGTANANAIGNIVTAQGNASGAAALAQGNIWGNAGNQLAAMYGRSSGGGGGLSGAQASFSQTSLGSSGSGTGLAYGNQDYGQYL